MAPGLKVFTESVVRDFAHLTEHFMTFCPTPSGVVTFRIMTLSIIALSQTKLSIVTLGTPALNYLSAEI